jgi:energy-coupling factor transporter ATP-binding protein EcfA2
VVGQSGSGKSTFLRLLTKEERPTAGRIWVAGKELNRLASWKVPALRRFSDPANARAIAYADPAPLVPTQLGGDWFDLLVRRAYLRVRHHPRAAGLEPQRSCHRRRPQAWPPQSPDTGIHHRAAHVQAKLLMGVGDHPPTP